MAAATRAGFSGAVPAIGGVVMGSVALLLLVAMGTGAVMSAYPRLLAALSAGGCLYLLYVGWVLIAHTFTRHDVQSETETQAHPSGVIGLFVFQFINPKAWMLTLTVVSAVRIDAQVDGDIGATILPLVTIFVVLPAICLSLWSWLGTVMSKLLRGPTMTRWFDRTMGILLVVSALVLLIESVAPVA